MKKVGKMRRGANGIVWGLFAFMILSLEAAVMAGTATGTFQVTATVPAYTCTVTTTTLTFGSYVPGSTVPLRYSNSVGVYCNGYLNVAIYPNNGTYSADASGTTRAMSTGGSTPAYLSYDIYTDSTYTKVWNATNTDTIAVVPYTTYYAYGYGQVPTGQFVAAGSFSDTVTAIVAF